MKFFTELGKQLFFCGLATILGFQISHYLLSVGSESNAPAPKLISHCDTNEDYITGFLVTYGNIKEPLYWGIETLYDYVYQPHHTSLKIWSYCHDGYKY